MAENPRIEELRRRVQADPASIAFAALAEEFRRVGRYEDAIETCRTGLQRHPAYLSARVTLGRALMEVGDYDGAREELQTVLRSAPENLAAIRGLAVIHERLGHSTEMHPDLHALADEPIRVAAPPPPPPAEPEPEPEPEIEPEPQPAAAPPPSLGLDSFAAVPVASHAWSDPAPAAQPAEEPFDIFGAALRIGGGAAVEPAAAESAVASLDAPASAFEPAPVVFEPPAMAFEPATIGFEAPVVARPPLEHLPEPHVAATLMRLEQFLGAIQAARHA